jgi:hypothetical protein
LTKIKPFRLKSAASALLERQWGAGMFGGVRCTALVFALAAPGVGSGALAATKVVPVNAKVAKPLSLTRVQDLDLGSVIIGPGTWSGAIVSISRQGVFRCTSANVTCSGTTQAATYTVSGSNNEIVKISAPNVTLTNQSDASQKLTLVVDSPGTVTLDNGGKKGTDFALGGSVTLNSSTVGGLYTGTFNVTVDY